jgi:hypothetical protein
MKRSRWWVVLGLVYLMFPPRSILSRERGTWELEVQAPLHQWVHIQSYDSAVQCEGAVAGKLAELDHDQLLKAQRAMLEQAVYWHMCVAAEDPRLR